MGFRCGLIGLPNAGKSTLFNALSAGGAEVAGYPFTTIDPNRAVVPVPDPRLWELSRLLNPEKTTPTHMEFLDIAGLVKGASRGEGLGNRFLGHIRGVQLLVHVLRCFQDPDVAHVEGSLDPARDLDLVRTELLLADLELLERRMDKARKAAKGGSKEILREIERIERFQSLLAAEIELRRADLTPEERALADEWGLLTHKPCVLAANVDEEEWSARRLASVLEARAREDAAPLVPVCAALEAEIAQLEPEEQEEYLREMGIPESALNRLIRVGYEHLGLITFYTPVGRELRAWSIPAGTRAPEAAGKIHSDMERGFIRAEIVSYDDFIRAGSMAKAREAGYVRLEGKEYEIRDGEIVVFRFNV